MRSPARRPRGGRPAADPAAGPGDTFTDIAYVCRETRKHWATRTGGFAGVNLRVGPFYLR